MENQLYTGKPITIPIGFRVPMDEYRRLADLAHAQKRTMSAVVRELVTAGLQSAGEPRHEGGRDK